jgi:hypothetical protein
MGWPQIAVIALTSAGLAISLAKHGEDRGRFSFPVALLSAAIEIGLLYAGGFFG